MQFSVDTNCTANMEWVMLELFGSVCIILCKPDYYKGFLHLLLLANELTCSVMDIPLARH